MRPCPGLQLVLLRHILVSLAFIATLDWPRSGVKEEAAVKARSSDRHDYSRTGAIFTSVIRQIEDEDKLNRQSDSMDGRQALSRWCLYKQPLTAAAP